MFRRCQMGAGLRRWVSGHPLDVAAEPESEAPEEEVSDSYLMEAVLAAEAALDQGTLAVWAPKAGTCNSLVPTGQAHLLRPVSGLASLSTSGAPAVAGLMRLTRARGAARRWGCVVIATPLLSAAVVSGRPEGAGRVRGVVDARGTLPQMGSTLLSVTARRRRACNYTSTVDGRSTRERGRGPRGARARWR